MSTRQQALLHLRRALVHYEIKVEDVTNWLVKLGNGYEIEVEANGLYKLMDQGQVVAPFDDLDELCRFILI